MSCHGNWRAFVHDVSKPHHKPNAADRAWMQGAYRHAPAGQEQHVRLVLTFVCLRGQQRQHVVQTQTHHGSTRLEVHAERLENTGDTAINREKCCTSRRLLLREPMTHLPCHEFQFATLKQVKGNSQHHAVVAMNHVIKRKCTHCPVSVSAHSSGGSSRRITSSVTSSGQELMKLCIAARESGGVSVKQNSVHRKNRSTSCRLCQSAKWTQGILVCFWLLHRRLIDSEMVPSDKEWTHVSPTKGSSAL